MGADGTASRRLFEAARAMNGLLPETALVRAVRHLAPKWTSKLGEPPPHLARECVELAGEFTAEAEEAIDREPERLLVLGKSPLSVVSLDERLRRVAPWIADVRSHYFNFPEPPFASYGKAAVEWIEHELRMGGMALLTEEQAARREEVEEQLPELADEWHELTGQEVEPTHPYRIEYKRTDGRAVARPVGAYDPLAMLAFASESIAGYLGALHQSAVVRYILSGEEPEFGRAHIQIKPHRARLPDGTTLRRDEVVLTLLAPLRRDELDLVLAHIADAWSRTDSPPRGRVTGTDLALYKIVSELGGADRERQPHGFWSEAMTRWRATGQDGVTTNTLAQRWKRLREKLEKPEENDATGA